jgi:hypothetical protein
MWPSIANRSAVQVSIGSKAWRSNATSAAAGRGKSPIHRTRRTRAGADVRIAVLLERRYLLPWQGEANRISDVVTD